MNDKIEPRLVISTTDVSNIQAEATAEASDMLLVYTRFLFQNNKQTVPPWEGWVSVKRKQLR